MIFGLDISTTKIGMSVLSNDGNDILLSDVLVFKKDSLYKRAQTFSDCVLNIKNNFVIDKIIVEEPLMVASTSMAHVISILQRFNGMCCLILNQIFLIEPILINPNKARSLAGLKFTKGISKKERKDLVVEFVKNKYPKFNIELTKFGNYKPGTDDKADAIVLAMSQYNMIS